MPTLCQTFRKEAGVVWNRMGTAARLGLSLSEETITECALYNMASSEPTRTQTSRLWNQCPWLVLTGYRIAASLDQITTPPEARSWRPARAQHASAASVLLPATRVNHCAGLHFLDNRWGWPSKKRRCDLRVMTDRPIPAANSWRTPPAPPRALRRFATPTARTR
jgi:hypothetical protein